MSQRQETYCCGRCGELVVDGKYAECQTCGEQPPHNKVSVYGEPSVENKKKDFSCQNCGAKADAGAAKEICPSCFSLNSFVFVRAA